MKIKEIDFRAILLGYFVYLLANCIVGLIQGSFLENELELFEVPLSDILAEVIIYIAIGGFVYFLGKKSKFLNVLVFAMSLFLIELLLYMLPMFSSTVSRFYEGLEKIIGTYPVWFEIFSFVLLLPAIMVGGYFASVIRTRSKSTSA